MSKEQIADEAVKAVEEFTTILSTVKPEKINTIPFEGSWTVGQLSQHIILFLSFFNDLLSGSVKDAERDPAQKAANLEDLFLNFETKMQSPEFIAPPIKVYKKEELLQELEELKNKLTDALGKIDLSKLCIAFDTRAFGYLTGLEAATFIYVHTLRHINQFGKINNALIV